MDSGHKRLTSIFLSSYTFILNGERTNGSGAIVPLLNMFKAIPGTTVYLLEQPLPGSDHSDLEFRKFVDGQEVLYVRKRIPVCPAECRSLPDNKTYFSFKFRDILSNFYFVTRYVTEKVDVFIGMESINTGCGILLKKLGYFADTAYYIFDWAPNRYPNRWVNAVYLALDKFSAYHCDATWNITYAIGDARLEILHYDPARISPQLYVPYCYNYRPENIADDGEVDPELLLYSGALIQENGIYILLEAFDLIARQHPTVRLRILGGRNDEAKVREIVAAAPWGSRVEVTGFIRQEAEIIRLQQTAVLALAPYPRSIGSRKAFGDVIKIRMYFACGLPVVTTSVPPVHREVREEELGLVTRDDSPAALADATLELLADRERLARIRRNVIEKAKISNWVNNFTNAFARMGYGEIGTTRSPSPEIAQGHP